MRTVAAVAALLLALAGCGGGSGAAGGDEAAGCDGTIDGPATVTAWFHSGTGEERETLERQVQRFNDSQDDVTVELTLLPELESTVLGRGVGRGR